MENVLSVCQDIMLTQMENANLYHLIVQLQMSTENVQGVNGVIISIQMDNANLFHLIVQPQM